MKNFTNVLLMLVTLLLLGVMAACGSTSEPGTETTTTAMNEQTVQTTELFVSAAASLSDAFKEIKEKFEANEPIKVTFNFGGSGKLAQQIQQGAPVDVFISANENWMDTLMEEGFIQEDTRVDVTGNKLVLITQNESPVAYTSFEDIEAVDIAQIAIGNPESVPAGEYTKAVLTNIDKWDALASKFVFAQDVRQVLTYVEMGNAEIGFVYESDAKSTDQVKVLAHSDPALHEAIIYPGAITVDTKVAVAAQKFLDYILSDEGQEILVKHGFTK